MRIPSGKTDIGKEKDRKEFTEGAGAVIPGRGIPQVCVPERGRAIPAARIIDAMVRIQCRFGAEEILEIEGDGDAGEGLKPCGIR